MNIQWYPGHMAKTRRQMLENLKNIDLVCELVDARIPQVSRNPDMDDIAGDKPRMIILNRTDLADPDETRRWAAWYRAQGYAVLETDSQHGAGTSRFAAAARERLADKIAVWNEKGQTGRSVRVMVVGIPNVGKSTFINRVAGKIRAKAENRPGVTRSNQWVNVGGSLELLDTPGILWPKFEDQAAALRLAFIGAIRDEVMDLEELACALMEFLARDYPACLLERYKVSPETGESGYDLLCRAGRKRGFLISGGEVDTERMAKVLMDEFRSGKLGRFTLEQPEAVQEQRYEE